LGRKLIILLVAGVILVSTIGISYANGWRPAIELPWDSQEPVYQYG